MLETRNTLECGEAFLELITRISTKNRTIDQSIVNQFELYDYSDYQTSQDGVRRHQYRHCVRYIQETGETWQFIVESKKDKRGYSYLAPNKNGNRAFFPAIPADIRGNLPLGVCVPLEGSFWEWLVANPDIPIIITEGGGKALATFSHGFIAIALYGCSCLGSPDLLPYLKGRDIYVALDCDTKPSAIEAVNRALSKHLRPLSKLAKSVKIVTWDSQYKGLDDFLAAKGGAALDDAIDDAISAKDWLRAKSLTFATARLEANKIKADLTLDRLPTFAELQEILKTHRDVFLVGAKGLGKSILGGEFVRNSDNALLPVPLESLARNNAQRFGIDYRTDCDRHEGKLINQSGYVKKLSFCTEAIQGLKQSLEPILASSSVVFNDELDLQLNSLATSSTHAQDGKRKINDSLYWEMQIRAKQTLSVSADLTQYEAVLWERKTGRKPYVIRVNTPKKTIDVRLFDNDVEMQFAELDQAIEKGDRLLICCSRKSQSKFLGWKYSQYGAIVIHRENANEPIFKGFFENPNQWLEQNKPKILIVSPVLRSGFSITYDAFDKVFDFFHSDSINASTALQLSERYRLPVPRYIFAAESSGKFNHISPEAILKTRKGRANAAGNNEISFVDENDPYLHYRAEDNWSKAYFQSDIIARLKDEIEIKGEIKIESYQLTPEMKAEHKADKAAFKAYEEQRLCDAKNLSREEYAELNSRLDLLESDYLALDKYRLANWSDTAPESVTISQIERDKNGRKRKALERLEKQAYPVLAMKADKHSVDVQKVWGYGVAHQDVTHTALIQFALQQIGLHEFLDFALAGNSWHIVEKDGEITGTDDAIVFAKKLRDLRNSQISHINKQGKEYFTHIDKLTEIGISLTCGNHASLTSYLGAMLSWLGLARIYQQETIKGRRVRVYSLNKVDLQISRNELTRRATRFIGEDLELIPSHAFVERIIDLHTPFYNVNIKRCVQAETVIETDLQEDEIKQEQMPDTPPIKTAAASREGNTKTPNAPSPNNKPSNKPSAPPKNESKYDRIKRLNEPLSEFCQAQYTEAQYGFA